MLHGRVSILTFYNYMIIDIFIYNLGKRYSIIKFKQIFNYFTPFITFITHKVNKDLCEQRANSKALSI